MTDSSKSQNNAKKITKKIGEELGIPAISSDELEKLNTWHVDMINEDKLLSDLRNLLGKEFSLPEFADSYNYDFNELADELI